MDTKRITVVCDYKIMPNRIGGMDRFYWKLNEELLKMNYDVKWIFPNTETFDHYIKKGLRNIIISKSQSLIETAIDYLKINNGCDLVICIFIDYNSSIPIRFKKLGAKRIMLIDQMSRPFFRRKFSYRLKYFLKGIINYFYIDKIVAVSRFVESCIFNEVGFWWKYKITVIYNSIDVKIFNNATSEHARKPNSIFCIAHLIEEKGVQDIITALSALPVDLKKKVTLTVAGDGIYKDELIKLTEHYDLTDNVHFIGNICTQDEYLHTHEICVIPSLWREAFGYTNTEAMASGCIVIASNIGGIPEIIVSQKNGFLFESGNSNDLRNKLIEVLKLDEVDKRNIVNNSTLTVNKKFNLHLNIASYLDCINKLMKCT